MLHEKIFRKASKSSREKASRKAIHSVANTGPQLKRREFFATSSLDSKSGRGFDPDDISGCMLWLKANSISASDGDDVTAWTDSSGEGHNVTVPSTASQRPHYKTGIMNGQPAILFTGSADEHLTTSGINDITKGGVDYTIFLVVKPTSVSTNNQLMFGVSNVSNWQATALGNNGNKIMMGIDNASKFAVYGKDIDSDVSIGTALSDNTAYVVSCAYDDSANIMWQFIDGTQTDKETSYESGTNSAGHPTMGARVVEGRGGNTYSNEYTGYIAEVIVFSSLLSERNLVDVNHYLGNKYGISVASKTRY